MNKLFYLLFFSFIGGNLNAQGTSEPKHVREANIAFESGKYFEAIDKLKIAYDKIGTKGSLKEKGNSKKASKFWDSFFLLEAKTFKL